MTKTVLIPFAVSVLTLAACGAVRPSEEGGGASGAATPTQATVAEDGGRSTETPPLQRAGTDGDSPLPGPADGDDGVVFATITASPTTTTLPPITTAPPTTTTASPTTTTLSAPTTLHTPTSTLLPSTTEPPTIPPTTAEPCLPIAIAADALFERDSDVLTLAAQDELQIKLGDVLTVATHATVTGFTDSDASEAHNLDLSWRRASAVSAWMTARGFDAASIEIVGVGETYASGESASPGQKAQDRRVEVSADVPGCQTR